MAATRCPQISRRLGAVEQIRAEHIIPAPFSGELERKLLEEQLMHKLARHHFLKLVMRQDLQIGQPFLVHLVKVGRPAQAHAELAKIAGYVSQARQGFGMLAAKLAVFAG